MSGTMFDYEQRPSNKYMDKFDDIEWNSKKESRNAEAKQGGEQEPVCNEVHISKEGRKSQGKNG